MEKYDLIVIGGGVSGMTSATVALEDGIKKVMIIERESSLGGLLRQCIHNGFGNKRLKTEITGPEYINLIYRKLNDYNAEIKLDTQVLNVSKEKVVTYVNPKEGVQEVYGKTIILATGCRESFDGNADIENEDVLGIFTIEDSHRIINFEGYLPGKEPVIVARNRWDLIVAKRFLIEGAKIRALIIQKNNMFTFNEEDKKIIEDLKISIMIGGEIKEIMGDKRIEGVRVYTKDIDEWTIVACDSLILSVNHFPELEYISKKDFEFDNITKSLKVSNFKTNVDGIFACGNLIYGMESLGKNDIDGIEAGKIAVSYIKETI